MKRIMLITGHYGSGKTEFSVNLAIDLKKKYDKVAILDMDIANPYFRSRERQQLMEDMGIDVYHNSFGYDITEDLPAISAGMRAPLENAEFISVVDVGGDDSGARVLNQFKKYFLGEDCDMYCVINANRPETDNIGGAFQHIARIQQETGLVITGLINNTHMLRETQGEDILRGYELCKEISAQLEIPLVWNTCQRELLEELTALKEEKKLFDLNIYPIDLYMRPAWLDR